MKISISKKAAKKDFVVEIKRTFSRFVSILLIVALGVAFYTGVRSTEEDMILSGDNMYKEGKLLDVRIVGKDAITKDDISDVLKVSDVKAAIGIKYLDVLSQASDKQDVIKLVSYSEDINVVSLKQGRKPLADNECIVDENYFLMNDLKLNQVIKFSSGTKKALTTNLKNEEFKIVGVFVSPYYMTHELGVSKIGTGSVNAVAYIYEDNFLQPFYNEIHVNATKSNDYISYSDDYIEYTKKVINNIKDEIDKDRFLVYGRESLPSYNSFEMDAKRIGDIGKVVPLLFFIVAALVSLTTMTRMVQEHRLDIGTYKALGYGNNTIAAKYLLYGLLASLSGGIIGGLIGSQIFPYIIINSYKMMYFSIQEILTPIVLTHFLTALLMAVLSVGVATYFSCYKELREVAASLMRPEPPKKNRKLVLERIPFIWKRFNFNQKSTIRNLFRYKKRVIMTLFGISGSMGLIIIGFGIKDSIASIVDVQYKQLHQYGAVVNLDYNAKEEDLTKMYNFLEENDTEYLKTSVESVGVSKEAKNPDDEFEDSNLFVADKNMKLDEYILLRDMDTKKAFELNDNEVIITKKLSKILKIEKGDFIKLKNNKDEMVNVKVSAVSENYVYHYVFMTESMYENLFKREVVFNQILIENKELTDKQKDYITKEFVKMDAIGGAYMIDDMKEKFNDMLEGLDIIILVLVISAGGLAFIVLYNLNNINISERIRELATLKVLGFYDKEVSMYIYRENIIITIVGIVIGVFVGSYLHGFIIETVEMDMVMFGRDVSFLSFLYSGLITLVFTIIINITMHYKLKKIDMTTSLKSVE